MTQTVLPRFTKERLLADPSAMYCQYQYWHSLGRNGTWRYKYGVCYGKIRHTGRHWDKLFAKQMALVQLIGNTGSTKVPYAQLRILTREEFEELA